MLSKHALVLLFLLLAYTHALVIKTDNGDCLTYSSDMKLGTIPTFSPCKNKPNQINWELRYTNPRQRDNDFNICIQNNNICIKFVSNGKGAIEGPMLAFSHIAHTDLTQIWILQRVGHPEPPARINTIKLTRRDPNPNNHSADPLCADVAFLTKKLKLSKCDEQSKSQRISIGI